MRFYHILIFDKPLLSGIFCFRGAINKGMLMMLVKQPPCAVPRPPIVAPVHGIHRKSPEPKLQQVVEREFAHARRSWVRYRSTRQRDAVYGYLSAVFEIVRRWKMLGHTRICSLHALRATRDSGAIRARDPFSIVILCTSDARIVDAKIKSKWSRCLRHADRVKPNDQSLTKFIKGQGGINNCADRWEFR